jgi:hypothetical protein
MTTEEKKETIAKSLTDALNKITESVMKQLETKPAEAAKTEKSAEAPAENIQTEKNLNTEVLDVIKNLQSKIDTLEKKFDGGVKTAEDVSKENITKKKEEIQAGMVELVKSMGIDPANIDLNFVIKEKKKSEVEQVATEEKNKFSKETSDNDSDDDLEKQLEGLSAEEKSGALNTYFKEFIKK